MKLKEWVNIWQEKYDRPSVRPSSFIAHGYVLKNHILPLLGGFDLLDIDEDAVGDFLEECRTHGNHRRAEPMKHDTMRHIWVLLRVILSKAVGEGLMDENPADAFHYETIKKVKAEPLSDEELEAYLAAAEELGYLAIFLLALEHGLWQREIIALKWSDLDIESCTLTVHMGRVLEAGKLVEYDSRTRIISLSPYAVEALIQEHAKHPSNPVMFIHPGTLKPYSPNMMRLLHSRVLKKAYLPHIRFMDLRHSYAVQAMKSGKTMRTIAEELGYTRTASAAKNYGEYLPREAKKSLPEAVCADVQCEQRKAADVLGNLIGF